MRRIRATCPPLELPGRIVRLAKADGKVFAILEDGRSIDVSDIGGEKATKQ